MKLDSDRQSIEIPCPNCRHKRAETLGNLKAKPKLTCSRCLTALNLDDADLRREVAKLENSFEDFGRSLGRLGK